MTIDIDRYVAVLRFAAERHGKQKVPGSDLPYLVHVTSVTGEVIAALPGSELDPDLAVSCALLHDTVEDTAKTDEDKLALADEIGSRFGEAVRDGVLALSKRKTMPDGTPLDKAAQMTDSLDRIRAQPEAVWAVKLADRITNLAPPPAHWEREKCAAYQIEARVILAALGGASEVLAERLRARIERYPSYWRDYA